MSAFRRDRLVIRRHSSSKESISSLIRSFNFKVSGRVHSPKIQSRKSFPGACRPEKGSGRIEDYTIQHEIGKGSFSSVYYSVYQPMGQPVALKFYDSEKLLNPYRKKSLLREIQALKTLRHPNVVHFFDKIETPTGIYLAFEYANSPNLREYINSKGSLHENEARALFKGILEGIAYCHSVGVSHGDIKAENILLIDNSLPLIIDFGFSTFGDSKVSLFRGSLPYMAPEIVNRKAYLTKHADVWALGVLLYTLLCGNYPFRGNSDNEVRNKIERGLYSVPKHVSATAAAFIAKMLDLKPENRKSCQELVTDKWILEADQVNVL